MASSVRHRSLSDGDRNMRCHSLPVFLVTAHGDSLAVAQGADLGGSTSSTRQVQTGRAGVAHRHVTDALRDRWPSDPRRRPPPRYIRPVHVSVDSRHHLLAVLCCASVGGSAGLQGLRTGDVVPPRAFLPSLASTSRPRRGRLTRHRLLRGDRSGRQSPSGGRRAHGAIRKLRKFPRRTDSMRSPWLGHSSPAVIGLSITWGPHSPWKVPDSNSWAIRAAGRLDYAD